MSISSQKRLWARLILLSLIGFLIWMMIPDTHLFYRSVEDSLQSQGAKLEVVKGKTQFRSEPKLFLVENGTLYLLVREARSISFLLAAFRGRDIHWTERKVRELLLEMPDLAKYLPDSDAEDFGIEWLSE